MINKDSRKHFQSILQEINFFEQKKIELGSLIGSIEFLLSNIQNNEKEIFPFWKEWGRLEEYYSVSIVEKDGKIDLQNSEILEAVKNLKKLSESALSSYLKNNDYSVSEKAIILNCDWVMCPKCTEAWELNSTDPMIICPKCNQTLHNPFFKNT